MGFNRSFLNHPELFTFEEVIKNNLKDNPYRVQNTQCVAHQKSKELNNFNHFKIFSEDLKFFTL